MKTTAGRYTKFIVTAVGALALALQSVLSDDQITTGEAVAVAIAVLTALGVYALPNTDGATTPAAVRSAKRTKVE